MVQALNSHPQIRVVGEELAKLVQAGANAQAKWTREFFSPPLLGRHKAIGFKTKLVDVVDVQGFADLLADLQALIVLLLRRNTVKLVISAINGKRLYRSTGRWQLYDEQQRLAPLHIAADEFQALLETVEQNRRDLNSYVQGLGLPLLRVDYEDLFLDQNDVYDRIFTFVGVPFRPVGSNIVKNTKDDLRQAVANFDELRSNYVGTRYEAMFDEVLFPE
jgi:hypothetical protein